MAVNRSLSGPAPLRYYASPAYWLEWEQVPEDDLPKAYKTHWLAYYKGRHVGEFFKSKSGAWWLVVFDRTAFMVENGYHAVLHMAALCIAHKQ